MNPIYHKPKFTDEQIVYLNKVFPENTTVPKDSSELYTRLGIRQVIKHIEQIRKGELK